ncbi:hypothetical protein [Flavobacterium sp.]|uniref:hypothetical protein n=1 Tax=Flavobacterium sp. TaxID=239 RepID=UPI002B4AD895|nr:hypothetical protein [Flavobacterium sp.]HLF50926.1 hypothetical protein [Flavobacterium sp.]
MNYENIYEGFYSKYYSKAEILIKNFFIKRHSQKRTFGNSINEVRFYLSNDFINKYILYNNENLHQFFCKRHSIYSVDEVQEVFENEIKIEFDKINALDLPADYNYPKFIKEIALIEVKNEISRLLSNNSDLLVMFFKLNEFDDFEIREHRGLSVEDYPIYKKLKSKLYPENYANFIENNDFKVLEFEVIDLNNTTATEKIIYLQKLGIIDFLKAKQPFQSSTNSLATVLSAIIGEKATTIQPMINPIVSKDVDSKNNPLNSRKAVNRVEQQLVKMGFNLNETI